MKKVLRIMIIGCCLIATAFVVEGIFNIPIVTKDVEAVIGRPLTPGSVAGVSRRTTRRVIRRTSVYVAALPRGCSTVVINGASLHQCGGTYYQPYNNQYVIVNVN
jgi:hypothetical protein